MPEVSRKEAHPEKIPFVVMAKPVGSACNLECGYCYYLETRNLYSEQQIFRMPDEILERFIFQYIDASPGPDILFVWHGGEPTLAGLDFFQRTVAIQKRYLPEGWTCRNNLQTNGVLVDEEWCSFLAENHFEVGLSIDGTQWVHDTYRKDRLGRGTFKHAEDAVHRLQSHGIQPDLLCTVTSASAREPIGIYRSLRNLDTGWIQFIPIIRRNQHGEITPESVSSLDYGRFLHAVFSEWVHHDIGHINVQFFAEMSLVLAGGTPSVCWMAPICGRVLVIEHDGSVYSCDHFVTQQHRIGNINVTSLKDLVNSTEQLRFGENKQNLLPEQCKICSWRKTCNGGCLKDRFILSEDGESNLNYLCEGMRYFFSRSIKTLEKVVRLRGKKVSPDIIMTQLRDEDRIRWKDIGRNDLCPCGSGLKAKICCWDQRP
jgi:uncharacterized protein